MFTTDLYVRLTHHFAPGWSDLDDDRHVGTARLTPWRLARPPQDYDDGGVYTSTATVRTQDRRAARAIERALADTLGGSRCRHEHDCCGCATTRAYARKISPREYSVYLSTYYNI